MNRVSRKRLCIMIPGHWSHTMGGAQYQAKCIIEEVLKTGRYDICYLTRHYDPQYTADGYDIIGYSYPGSNIRGSHRLFFETAILTRILKKIKPDIIYQRVGCAQTGIAAHYARKHRCQMVWHIAHEYDLKPPRSRFSRLYIYRLFDRWLLDYGIRHASQIIAQTEDQNRLLFKNFNRSATAVIPNFHPAPREIIEKRNPIKIIWLANLKSFKQPEIFIRLADELKGLSNCEFIMIGAIQGSASTRHKYLDLIQKVQNLEYLGPKHQDEVNTILAQSHILVNTSRSEGFSNTFIQAWLRKMPVASLHVNPDNLIKKHSLGFVSGSFEQLKRDVRTLVTDTELRIRLGLNAQDFAYRSFSTRNAAQLLEVFEFSSSPQHYAEMVHKKG